MFTQKVEEMCLTSRKKKVKHTQIQTGTEKSCIKLFVSPDGAAQNLIYCQHRKTTILKRSEPSGPPSSLPEARGSRSH